MSAAARWLEAGDVLEEIVVTDRVFHDLRFTQPLVAEIVRRVVRLKARRVVAVAPNALLPEVLVEGGLEVEVWHHPEAILTDRMHAHVTRHGNLDELLEKPPVRGAPDAVILPYTLEAVTAHPVEVLARLRRWLPAGAAVIAAYHPAGALGSRMRGLSGTPVVPDPYTERLPLSYSWPPLAARRTFTPDQLAAWCLEAGFRVDGQSPVVATRAAVAINALGLGEWLGVQASHLAVRAVPALRDTVVAVLTSRPASLDERLGRTRPRVTVLLTATDSARLERALSSLHEQSYAKDRLDVRVLEGEVGPKAMNEALRDAPGDVVGVTDDCCELPRKWVDIGVSRLTGWTCAVTGRTAAAKGSATPFLDLPGARPTRGEEPWFSASNSFYVRAAALEVGGFDESFEHAGHAPRAGWDATLARRIRRDGLPVRTIPELTVTRLFAFPGKGQGRGRWLGAEYRRARELPAAVRSMPELRKDVLAARVFASWRSAAFELLVAAIVVAALTRQPLWLCLVLPWLASVRRHLPYWPPSQWSTAVRNLRGMVVRQVVWAAGLFAGSLAARRVVL